jgi:hypothetical protein
MQDASQDSPIVTKTSSDFPPGSKKWHFAVADEFDKESQTEKDQERVLHLKELAEFHRAIGKWQ